MSKLARLSSPRIGRDELVFVVLSILVYVSYAHLPKVYLAEACLLASVAVKAVGLPAQIRKMAKDGTVAGMSLSRNVLDYQSYVLWVLYGQAIHSPVLVWGQLPGAMLVWLITWLNLRHGAFPWKPRPILLGDLEGHFASVENCLACRSLGSVCTDRFMLYPDCPWSIRGNFVVLDEMPRARLERCGKAGCRGVLHLVEVVCQPQLLESPATVSVTQLWCGFQCDAGGHDVAETIYYSIRQNQLVAA